MLELHGWGGLQDELNALSKQGKWVEMGTLIDDEILNTFAVVGEPEPVAPELHTPLRRRDPADLLLRAVQVRSGTLARGDGRPQLGLTAPVQLGPSHSR